MTEERTAAEAKEGREECLEALYRLERAQQSVSLESLRDNRDLSGIDIPATVLDLIERGDVEIEEGKIILKRSGLTTGKRIYRRHEIAERFLRLLGMKTERAHREACRLEHIVSLPDEISLISDLLGRGAVPLTRAVRGVQYCVGMVCGGRAARRKLEDLGVSRGAEISLCTRQRGGPVEIAVRGSRLALGRGIASKVLLVPAAADDGVVPDSTRSGFRRRRGRAACARRGW